MKVLNVPWVDYSIFFQLCNRTELQIKFQVETILCLFFCEYYFPSFLFIVTFYFHDIIILCLLQKATWLTLWKAHTINFLRGSWKNRNCVKDRKKKCFLKITIRLRIFSKNHKIHHLIGKNSKLCQKIAKNFRFCQRRT